MQKQFQWEEMGNDLFLSAVTGLEEDCKNQRSHR